MIRQDCREFHHRLFLDQSALSGADALAVSPDAKAPEYTA